jgi:c-di-GMP-binding flagellar brake protein YcgR
MNIVVDSPLKTGQIIHTKFYLSKIPLVYMEIFGEVVHSTKVNECGKTQYSLGIKFLDLSVNDQERIIASIFQSQRKVLRKRKTES